MGRGIAQIAAQAGVRVLLFDIAEGAAAQAREALLATFEMLRAKGKLSEQEAHRAWRLGVCLSPPVARVRIDDALLPLQQAAGR